MSKTNKPTTARRGGRLRLAPALMIPERRSLLASHNDHHRRVESSRALSPSATDSRTTKWRTELLKRKHTVALTRKNSPGENVRIVRVGESLLELHELRVRERRAIPALLPARIMVHTGAAGGAHLGGRCGGCRCCAAVVLCKVAPVMLSLVMMELLMMMSVVMMLAAVIKRRRDHKRLSALRAA